MEMTQHPSLDQSVYRANQRVNRYAEDAATEGWMKDHRDAMVCRDLEVTIKHGIELYEFFHLLDEEVRRREFGPQHGPATGVRVALTDVFKKWLKTGEKLLADTMQFEGATGHVCDHLDEFRAKIAEARWMLLPASEAFGADEFSELRDQAVEELRAGRVKCDPQ